MIKNIIDLLNADEWLIGDNDINFAKGGNQLPNSWKDARKLLKRNKQ